MAGRSIVEWFGPQNKNSCGYCNSRDRSFSHGMWAHSLTPLDYQDLIDRGWRRSGKYVYKPTLQKTCCPAYPIRCAALDLTVTKSQRQVIKRFNKYINHDIRPSPSTTLEEGEGHEREQQGVGGGARGSARANQEAGVETGVGLKGADGDGACKTPASHQPKPGCGADPSKPPCIKAKDRRRQLKLLKQGSSGESDGFKNRGGQEEQRSQGGQGLPLEPGGQGVDKSLEDLLSEFVPTPAHRLEIRLVESEPRSAEFESSLAKSHALYVKYQTRIHGDKPDKVSLEQFTGFLVDSPLTKSSGSDSASHRLGSYHQQYWLDGQLIAVGVLDLLPRCVSSVYLFYDPDYSFLSIGTYSALRELGLTRELHRVDHSVQHYYMGFYIHSCPKMRYKGGYNPSSLCCPETYTWQSLPACVDLLNASPYSRLAPPGFVDADAMLDVDAVLCLHKGQAMPYSRYRAMRRAGSGAGGTKSEADVRLYAALTGRVCSTRMLLYRD